eukprot:1193549-Prorocentrum_minimum.AAC.3
MANIFQVTGLRYIARSSTSSYAQKLDVAAMRQTTCHRASDWEQHEVEWRQVSAVGRGVLATGCGPNSRCEQNMTSMEGVGKDERRYHHTWALILIERTINPTTYRDKTLNIGG